jgi:hypothetical protein
MTVTDYVYVEVDLEQVDAKKLRAALAAKQPVPEGFTPRVSVDVDAGLVDRAYRALAPGAPEPIRELVLELSGRIA